MSNGFIDAGDTHRLYFETLGNPSGEPVLVLHGGPGSGCSPRLAELYDTARQWVNVRLTTTSVPSCPPFLSVASFMATYSPA